MSIIHRNCFVNELMKMLTRKPNTMWKAKWISKDKKLNSVPSEHYSSKTLITRTSEWTNGWTFYLFVSNSEPSSAMFLGRKILFVDQLATSGHLCSRGYDARSLTRALVASLHVAILHNAGRNKKIWNFCLVYIVD